MFYFWFFVRFLSLEDFEDSDDSGMPKLGCSLGICYILCCWSVRSTYLWNHQFLSIEAGYRRHQHAGLHGHSWIGSCCWPLKATFLSFCWIRVHLCQKQVVFDGFDSFCFTVAANPKTKTMLIRRMLFICGKYYQSNTFFSKRFWCKHKPHRSHRMASLVLFGFPVWICLVR